MLTVFTQNIWGGAPLWRFRRSALARRIAELQPDFVGLQEVHAPDPHGAVSQAHELAGLVPGYRAIFAPGRISRSRECEGVAILSRHSVAEIEVGRLSLDRADLFDRLGQRVVLHAVVETPDGPVDAFVTHLSVSRRARSRTVPELLAFASRKRDISPGRAAILLGDLNAGPAELAIGALIGDEGHPGSGWVDSWISANGPAARGETWPALIPHRRIDYALVHPTGRWVVHSVERLPPSGSDHLGIVARLGLIDPTGDRPDSGRLMMAPDLSERVIAATGGIRPATCRSDWLPSPGAAKIEAIPSPD